MSESHASSQKEEGIEMKETKEVHASNEELDVIQLASNWSKKAQAVLIGI